MTDLHWSWPRRCAALGRIAVIGAAVVAGLPGCGGDPTATDPRKVLADGFVAGLDGTTILAEGGTVIGGYDAWLALDPAPGLTPRFEDAYRPIPCAEPAAWFAARGAATLERAGDTALDCRAFTDERLSIANGRWLVTDRRDGRVYFRAWKRVGD
jgi:hypothetical protein